MIKFAQKPSCRGNKTTPNRKPLSWGHLAIMDKMLGPNSVHYRGGFCTDFQVTILRLITGKVGLESGDGTHTQDVMGS